jgi:hypothetical protein
VSCHDGDKKEVVDLTGTPVDDADTNKRRWSRSYLNLTEATRRKGGDYGGNPEQGLVTWISKMSRPTELPPYFSGAAKSPLLKLLDDGHYDVGLSDEEFHKLAAWMDLLVPFCGTYREAHAWSDEEMRFYGYFEAKRDAQALEEVGQVAAYLTAGGGDTAEAADPPAFTQATYRALIGPADWRRDGHGMWVLARDHEPALVDRFECATGQSPVRVLRGDHELARLGPDATIAVLAKPVRSTGLRIEGEDRPALRGFGVTLRELPEHDGYRRHLDFAW